MKIEDIKFKAKRLDNGEWIVGSLIRSTEGVKERTYIVDNFSSMSDYSVVGVSPSTVCQFTGLKDCEGKDIWEAARFANALAAVAVQRLGTTPAMPTREEIEDFINNN